MANSFVRYTGDGSTATYSVPFSYRAQEDVTVTLNGVVSTAFTWNGAGTQITFTSAPASAVAIEIRRTTSQGTKLVDYASGSVLTESDLDTDSDQAFFMSQEAIDDAGDVIKLSNVNFQWDAENKRLTNVADPTSAQDAATKNWSETAMSSQLTQATTQATNAATSATNASTSETNAAASATAAASSASAASTSETNAASSASAASTSETNAATSETNAATSATTATTQATNAATSATAAQTAQAAAEAAADNFDDTYLGAKASDPTLDNDGDALTAGDLYFNTSDNSMKVYDGSSWNNTAVSTTNLVSKTSNTGSAELPSGTTAQRDGSPSAGYIRFNADNSSFEGYDGSAWDAIPTTGNIVGKQSIWIPATAMYPNTTNGCAPLAQVELANGVELKVLDFDASADENAQFSIAFPKLWNEGTVTFQAFFTVTGTDTGTVAWGLSAVSIADNDSINSVFGTNVVATAKAHSGTSNDLNVSAESGAVTIAGSPSVNETCFFQLMRDVSADTQTGDARLVGIKLFFTTDALTDD
jgi:hypothetical protein